MELNQHLAYIVVFLCGLFFMVTQTKPLLSQKDARTTDLEETVNLKDEQGVQNPSEISTLDIEHGVNNFNANGSTHWNRIVSGHGIVKRSNAGKEKVRGEDAWKGLDGKGNEKRNDTLIGRGGKENVQENDSWKLNIETGSGTSGDDVAAAQPAPEDTIFLSELSTDTGSGEIEKELNLELLLHVQERH